MLNKKDFQRGSCIGLTLLALALASPARAQTEAVAYVKTVTGEAWVNTAGQSVRAQLGTPVMPGSQLKTAAASSLGVTFKDNTVMSFGPDTELTVDEYIYSPAKDELKLSVRMTKGTLDYLSGVIAKLKPDAVTIKTLAGIIGVRGTQFVVSVLEPK
jgi:hypothetical protein